MEQQLNMNLKELIDSYQNFLITLPLQGVIAVFSVILAIVFLIWEIFFWHPLQNDKDKIVSEINLQTTQLQALQTKLANLKQYQSGIFKNAAIVSSITAKKIPEILKTLINTQYLKLISLESVPAKVTHAEEQPIFNRQDIDIKFTGDFFSTLGYLKTIEKLNLPFYWDSFNYKVSEYPTAEVEINLHTLSNVE